MRSTKLFKVIFSFFLVSQFCFSQVDIVYSNLVWSDEFNTNGPVDTNNWFHQTQLPNGTSWFSGEVQHYTNLPGNSYVDNGLLHIVAKKETFTDQGVTKEYTSARLNSKFAFKYGRVDVRAKVPLQAGTWPAIWMLGRNINEPGAYFASTYGTTDWPACGETDIMEHGIFPSQPTDYIQGTLHTPSSFGNSVNNGGIIASDLANSYHIYSVNWSPFQISFLLDGVVYYTYNPTVKDANTWPFDKEQYLLLNVAMGGTAGNIDSNFTQASMDIDYVRIYQNTLVDTERPTNFTATIGAVTSSTVELLLNSNDNSGNVVYNVSYGTQSVTSAGTSGVQKSVVISDLNPNTNYSFTVTASDLSGNSALNNPIVLNATTSALIACSGTSSLAQQGSFTTGYNYTFQTLGTDVKINCELLDIGRVGVVAYLWRQTPFLEMQMTNVSGNIFTKTITGQTPGTSIRYAVKFAYAGGLSVTNYLPYVVGNNNCSLDVTEITESEQLFYPNPVVNNLNLHLIDSQNKITITDVLGKIHFEGFINSDDVIDMSSFKSGIYFLRIENSKGIKYSKIIKN